MFSVVYWTGNTNTIYYIPIPPGLLSGLFVGWFSDRYGPCRVLLLSTILHIIPTLLQPVAALYAPPYASVMLRGVLGVGFVRCDYWMDGWMDGQMFIYHFRDWAFRL
jgi:MFS family permease